MHGGISPNLRFISDINYLDRFQEIPKQGLLTDLMWSDPIDTTDTNTDSKYFTANKKRGCSYFYTDLAVEKFLQANNLICLIRAHQVQKNGIHMNKELKKNKKIHEKIINSNNFNDIFVKFPSIITIFSAPNYCDVYQNKGGIIHYTGVDFKVKLFRAVEHPYVPPHFLNAFEWTLPFIEQKITEMINVILKLISESVFHKK